MRKTSATMSVRAVGSFLVLCMGGCSVSQDHLPVGDVSITTGSLSAAIASVEEPLDGPLDVHDVIARAVKYNTAIRTQELAAALAEARAKAQSLSLLPSIVAQSDVYGRGNAAMSHSNLSPTYSTSSDLRSVTSDLKLSWSILDFGLSFIRNEQALDKAAKEHGETRRVMMRVIEDTRNAFWRAVAYDRMSSRLGSVQADVEKMLKASQRAFADSRLDPMVSLSYERDILNLRRELNQLRTSLAGAREQLKQLIGLPQSAELRLRPSPSSDLADILLNAADRDVQQALESRVEIRQITLDMKITDKEVHATILQLLPGITLSRGVSNDSNSFLLNASWISWGTKIAWNLVNLAHLPRDLDVVEAQQQVDRQQAVAMAATIAMQVYVSRARIDAQRQAASDARVFADVQDRLLKQVRGMASVGTVAPQALAKERLATLLAQVRSQLAEADLQAAVAAYSTSIGLDPLTEIDINATSAAFIAATLRSSSSTRQSSARWEPTVAMKARM